MRPTLRARVVLAAGGAIVVAVVVLAVAVSVLAAHHLRAGLDASLRDRAAEVARLSASAPALLTAPGALDDRLGGEQLSIEVLDARGRTVARSLSLGGRLLPTRVVRRVIATGRGVYANDRVGEERLRLYVAPLPAAGGLASGGAVIVAGTTSDIASTLDRLHVFALLSALAAAGLAAAAAFVLVRRALRPLEQLTAGAEEVARTEDPARRLADPGTDDEVGRLAQTLNRMLGSLERARNAERRFLADASHELRTPVTALRGNVDYLRRRGYDEAVLAELAADAERLSALTHDLLALSREDAGGGAETEVRLDELARRAATDDGRVVVDAPEPVAVRADAAALERALANLLENARRYGPPDGPITVSARRENGVARLSVRDEGAGLSEEDAAAAFERFWRGSHETPGSGLGLAIVRATAERHGGHARASGSEFTIELPALREFSDDAGRPPSDPEGGTP